MGVHIPNMEMPKNAFNCSIKINPEERRCIYTGKVFEETLSLLIDRPCGDCPLIEVRDDYFKYYLECERLNDSRDLLKHRGCMDCDVKLKCLYAFTPEAEECNHYSNTDQHTQSVESALNRESCNFAFHSICTYGDCSNCPYEGEGRADEGITE